MRNIGCAITHPEIYLVVIYFLVDGLLDPNFQDYSYFFYMEEVGVSKFMFAMIALVGQVVSVLGVILYERCLKTYEVRYVVMIGFCLQIFGAFLNYAFAMRWNLSIGISDYVFLFASDVVFASMSIAFATLPLMALFAKITPKRIEGTIFAFLTGTWNLDATVIQPLIGNFINSFVGVTKDDLSGYSTLMLIGFIMSPLGIAYAFLIPLREFCDEQAKIREEDEKKEDEERQKRRQERQRIRAEGAAAGAGEGGDEEPLIARSIN